jgi:hypothetical protein
MPAINLSDIQKAAEKKFGDFEIHVGEEVLYFSQALRMEKAKRRELAKAMNLRERSQTDNDDDLYDVFKDAFRITARGEGTFDKLYAAVGDDPAVWQELFQEFTESTQAGEASPSES